MTDMLLIAGWCFAASLLLPLFGWALMPFLPPCAATRHLVWLVLFAVLLILPVLALVVPSHMVFPTVAGAAPAAAPVAVVVPQGWSTADAVSFLILVWLAGILFHLGRLVLGLFGLHRLRRTSVPFDGAQDVRLADDGPLAFGLFRPLILLPHEADNWPLARLVAVLAHERAHLRRRDCLSQMLAQIVCAFYWPNPLLWLGARRLRQEAEMAADNAALASGIRASDYAAELLQLAGQSLRLPAAAMAAPSLEARVKSVLSPTPLRTGVSIMDGLKIAWLGSAAVVALALVRPALAEVQEPPVVQASPLPAPVAAPAPAAAPAPPAHAAPVADMIPPAAPAHHHHHPRVSPDQAGLSPDEQAQLDTAIANVHATLARLRPQIEQAIAKAHADQKAAQAIQQAMPQIHAAIAQAMAEIQPALHRAVVNERVDVKVSVALDRAQAQIDRAVVHVERDAEHDAARAQHDAEREAAHAARAQAHGRDENPDPGDTNPSP